MKLPTRWTAPAPARSKLCIYPPKIHHPHTLLFASKLPHSPIPCISNESRRYLHNMSSASMPYPDMDLFRYTSGRWLWDEEQQLRDRFSPFNVPELQRIAAQSIGADPCTAITKLAEGSFNRTFRLEMDDGSSVIARIPHPNAGPSYYTTASEVATMEFVRIGHGESAMISLTGNPGPHNSRNTDTSSICLECRCE